MIPFIISPDPPIVEEFLEREEGKEEVVIEEVVSVEEIVSVEETPVPEEPQVTEVQEGVASWYGEPFHGRRTASGEEYDMYSLTAAHRDLEFGTTVRVINSRSGRSVRVKINDRGPFVRGRIIDLSMKAAEEIGIKDSGVGEVKIEVLDTP